MKELDNKADRRWQRVNRGDRVIAIIFKLLCVLLLPDSAFFLLSLSSLIFFGQDTIDGLFFLLAAFFSVFFFDS